MARWLRVLSTAATSDRLKLTILVPTCLITLLRRMRHRSTVANLQPAVLQNRSTNTSVPL